MKFVRIVLLGLLLAPTSVFAAPSTFRELASTMIGHINLAIPLLITGGIVVYFYGISTNILNFSNDGKEKVRAYFFWGILILFVMISIWGILAILTNTFLL